MPTGKLDQVTFNLALEVVLEILLDFTLDLNHFSEHCLLKLNGALHLIMVSLHIADQFLRFLQF